MVAESESISKSTEADSGTGSRRTTSNKETDAGFNRLNQDVGVDEAYQAAVLANTRAWDANTKQAYDTLATQLDSAVKQHEQHLSDLHTVRLQMLTTMTVNSDNLQKQHLAHRDIATNRTWTQIDELESVMATLVAKAVADAVNKKVV